MTLALARRQRRRLWRTPALEHAVSFASGFKHPWTGLDHMLAMVAVGLWAGLNGGRALWAWPVAFVGVMVVGGALGIAGVAAADGRARHPRLGDRAGPAGADRGAAAGRARRGARRRLRPPARPRARRRAAGRKPPPSTYAAGFALATALLHAIGLGVAYLAGSDGGRLIVRGAGALVAAAGVALAVI